jgi:peptidyl-prolyl cis-trans isomerase A (cyclophilin A)
MKLIRSALLALATLWLAACDSDQSEEAGAAAPENQAQPGEAAPQPAGDDGGGTAAAEPQPVPEPAGPPRIRLETNKGAIVLELDPDKAPITVKNFLGYIDRKHYDGTVFHRVIDGFMIQGGGFALQQNGSLVEKRTGVGIKNEGNNGLKNNRGTVAMARTGNPDSATAQFFINVSNNDGLNYPDPDGHGYAVFGKVVEGMEVVDAIKVVPTTTKTLTMLHPVTGQQVSQPAPNVPQQPVVIQRAVLLGAE